MAEKTLANVPFSFLEYRATYREPIFNFPTLYNEATAAVFAALREWNVTLENVFYRREPANLSEMSVNFTLLGGRFIFSFGLGASGLLVTNPNWAEAELVTKIARTGLAAIQKATGVVIEKQQATVAMHLKPKRGSILEFTAGLVRLDANELPGGNLKAFGISVYREDSSWLVDASATYPDTLFVRINRAFDPEVSLDQIAAQLKADEEKLLELLRLEVE